jgi:hypothetical protein
MNESVYEVSLTNQTGPITIPAKQGLLIHQITICSATTTGSAGSATAKLKMESAPSLIPLKESGSDKVFTYGAADTETGDVAILDCCSIESIKITGTGTYSVGYAAFAPPTI